MSRGCWPPASKSFGNTSATKFPSEVRPSGKGRFRSLDGIIPVVIDAPGSLGARDRRRRQIERRNLDLRWVWYGPPSPERIAMTDLAVPAQSSDDLGEKGLKGGALGLISSTVVGVASTAPAYSLAATLGFVVIAINGLQAPIITILAFVPMLFISYGYKELNFADPDCGTTFTLSL